MKKLFVAFFLCLLLPNIAMSTHMDKVLFLEIVKTGDVRENNFLRLYLKGILHGIEASNMTLIKDGNRLLFCNPQDIPLTTDWLIENLLEYFARYPLIPDSISIPVVASYTMKDKFPCAKVIGQ